MLLVEKMTPLERILFLGIRREDYKKRALLDTLFAIAITMALTIFLYLLRLYPRIPNISLLYILIVLGFSSTRGLYSALVASITAFIAFDFFMVDPHFTFTVARFDEWLALFIFLITAVITGQLASALRQREQLATQRAQEMRELYTLVNAVASERDTDHQLRIMVKAILKNFSTWGILDCGIYLPDEKGILALRANALQEMAQIALLDDEQQTATLVFSEGQVIDLYNDIPETAYVGKRWQRHVRVITSAGRRTRYVRLFPLRLEERVIGVLRLLMEERGRYFYIAHMAMGSGKRVAHQDTFFWTFLDQVAAIIERGRLRREAIQIEILRRTDDLRAALLSSVSHDLRTPLASIKAAASSMLQEDVQWDEEARRSFIDAIVRESDRLNHLVGNLLDMSRIEGGAIRPEKEWYPIDELIHDVLSHMQPTLQNHPVQVELAERLPPVALDYLQLDQVLTNLLENAARYTPAGSPIEVTTMRRDNDLLISIADRGPGIPSADLERIFDKFYRVSGIVQRTSSTIGTGLGLAVCRGLIEAHGGHIWAENRAGGGAVFHLTLPLNATPVQDLPATASKD